MAMPKFNKPEGMLDSIKSKLGFSDGGDYYDRGRKDYDDYDSGDYDDYDDDYEEDDAAPSSNYDPYDSVTTRPARGNHARSSVGSGGYRPAKLVSIDDVRAHTTVPDSLNRDPLPPRKVSSASFGNRTMVDPPFTAPANTPNARAAAAADQERSESLNALFSTTAAEAAESSASPAGQTAAKPIEGAFTAAAKAASAASSFDPYKAYEGTATGTHSPTRSVTIVKPASYGECEKVAKALKAGDAVVLALKETPDALAKRVLDFSFGVSSALDASVDCVADKVFVIARGAALSEAERASLRSQGIL